MNQPLCLESAAKSYAENRGTPLNLIDNQASTFTWKREKTKYIFWTLRMVMVMVSPFMCFHSRIKTMLMEKEKKLDFEK